MTATLTRPSYSLARKAPPRRSGVAPVLLIMMVLAISIGPRISLSVVDGEIRVQDLLIFPAMLYLLLSRTPDVKSPLLRLLGALLPVFLWGSVITVAFSLVAFPEVAAFRRVLFYGRTVEMIVLAVVVAGLYLRSGPKVMGVLLKAVSLGAVLNLLWVGYQMATDQTRTLLGDEEFASSTGSYGPMLIGEPTAFGVGQYWAFIAAVAASQIKAGRRPLVNLVLFAGAFGGAWVAESRISVGAIAVMAGIILIMGRDRKRGVNILGILAGAFLTIIGTAYIFPLVGGRLTPEAVTYSFNFRVQQIWEPFAERLTASPLIGIGPGGLTGAAHLSEAHNIILRALLDFGFIVGLIFLALFVRAMVRGFKLARTVDVDQETRIAGYLATFVILSTLVSGMVQDALTAVMPSHLTMIAIGILAAQRARWLDSQTPDQ